MAFETISVENLFRISIKPSPSFVLNNKLKKCALTPLKNISQKRRNKKNDWKVQINHVCAMQQKTIRGGKKTFRLFQNINN